MSRFMDIERVAKEMFDDPSKTGNIWGSVRDNNPGWQFLQDQYASIRVTISLLWTFQSLVVVILAVGSPCFYYFYRDHHQEPIAFNMSWTVVSLAVIFPLTMSLTSAFGRREQGLQTLATFKSAMISTFLAHRDWHWGTGERSRASVLRAQHVGDVCETLRRLMINVACLLTAPITTKARHIFNSKKLSDVNSKAAAIEEDIQDNLNTMQALTEELKDCGLPGNEAARIRSYFEKILNAIEVLVTIKEYRTPLGIRCLSRTYILLTPIIYGPYYAYLGGAGDHDGIGLAFSIAFSLLTSLAMQGIFCIRLNLEDPFDVEYTLDAIDVVAELRSLNNVLLRGESGSKVTKYITANADRMLSDTRSSTSSHRQIANMSHHGKRFRAAAVAAQVTLKNVHGNTTQTDSDEDVANVDLDGVATTI